MSQTQPSEKERNISAEEHIAELLNQDDENRALEARKRSLLQTFAPTEGLNYPDAQAITPVNTHTMEDNANISMTSIHNEEEEAMTEPTNKPQISEQEHAPTQQDAGASSTPTVGRRAKLDMSGARRLLFGSLGVKTPKTKADEEKLRNKFQEQAEHPKQVEDSQPEAGPVDDDHDYDSWQDKIDLKAVECCYDGVELSTPPFPFVQRWDPQQQNNYSGRGKRGGKGKRRKRNNRNFYQDEEFNGFDGSTDYQLDYFPENDTGNAASGQKAAEDQIVNHDQVLSTEKSPSEADLPLLPSDLSSLEVATIRNTRPGAIIAFKQMEMSENTNWCPVISEYRTCKVEKVLENGMIQARLAVRDVPLKEKKYDSETGERVYSKFEMPDSEDENEEQDVVELGFADMIDAKLVQASDVVGESLRTDWSVGKATTDSQSNQNVNLSLLENDNLTEQEDNSRDEETQDETTIHHENDAEPMSETSRREYSLLMKDAGFRSDVDSNIREGILPRTTANKEDHRPEVDNTKSFSQNGSITVNSSSDHSVHQADSPMGNGGDTEIGNSFEHTGSSSYLDNSLEVDDPESREYQPYSFSSTSSKLDPLPSEDPPIKLESSVEPFQNRQTEDSYTKPELVILDDSDDDDDYGLPPGSRIISQSLGVLKNDSNPNVMEYPSAVPPANRADLDHSLGDGNDPSDADKENIDDLLLNDASFSGTHSPPIAGIKIKNNPELPPSVSLLHVRRTRQSLPIFKGIRGLVERNSSPVVTDDDVLGLTLSSDLVEPEDDTTQTSLPHGPGWVTKIKKNQRSLQRTRSSV
jgi:hypothetical protein